MNLNTLFPDCRTEMIYRSVWKNIIILLQISGQRGIDFSVEKRFSEERNLTKENTKKKAEVINTLKNIRILCEK